MESMGDQIKKAFQTHMQGTISDSEIGRYNCEGCGNEVIAYAMPVLFGPEKGTVKRMERGCICWELQQAREAKQEQKQAKLKQLERYNMVNVNLSDCSFMNYSPASREQQTAFETAFDFADSFKLDEPRNLLFAGSYGLGKSHLAYSIVKALKEKGFGTIFVSMPKLLTMLKDTYNEKSQFTESELITVLSTVDLLVIDDLGAEKSRKGDGETWATEKLFEIVDGRAGRHTIYTTNLNALDLRKNVGDRNFSRMMQGTKAIKFAGDDYRLKNAGF